MPSYSLLVNGRRRTVEAAANTPLLWVLRDNLGMTGTKFGCGIAQCGACTVHLDGEAVRSCVLPIAAVGTKRITTIEGLAPTAGLHPLQQAFIRHDGFQCGYSTPGQICSAVAMLEEHSRGTVSAVTADVKSLARPRLTEAEIRERMSGNICRCGAYVGIVAAIADVAGNSA